MILILKSGRKFEIQDEMAKTLSKNMIDSSTNSRSVFWDGEVKNSDLLFNIAHDEIALMYSETSAIKEIEG